MVLTLILSAAGCILLFLCILGVTITLPMGSLIQYFPEDVQESLRPRIENHPMSPKRILGWIILIMFLAGYIGLFIIGGLDGKNHGFTFFQFFLRFFVIGAVIKAFDIICLDYYLLTKTHFFQRFFPETESCAGWQDFGYNRKQQIRQCILILFGSVITAWIFTMV